MNAVKTIRCPDFDKKCLNEAVKTLSQYNTNFFMKKHMECLKLGKMPNQNNLRKLIGAQANCKELIDYTDELKMYGKQHVFLYALTNKAYLEKLSSPDYIRQNHRDICIWKSEEPYLASVRYVTDERQIRWLSFKWIETRKYNKWINSTLQRIFEERSANFFLINLDNGSAQLRIQSLPPKSIVKIMDEYNIYVEKIKEMIDFHHFAPVSLEPIMRKFLYKRILSITHWNIKSRKREILQGNRANPTIIQRLRLPFLNFSAHEIMAYWECRQDAQPRNRLYFSMNGLNNYVTFNSVTDKLKVDFILDTLQEIKSEKLDLSSIKTKELKKLADEYPEELRIIIGIDNSFSRLKIREIHSNEIASDLEVSDEKIRGVFKKAAEMFPKRFYTYTKNKGDHLILVVVSVVYDGLIDKPTRELGDSFWEKVFKSILKISGIPVVALNWWILKILGSLIENWIQDILGIPFIVIKILVSIILLNEIYGSKRIRKYLYKTPSEGIKKILKNTSDGIINCSQFTKWLPMNRRGGVVCYLNDSVIELFLSTIQL